MEYRAFILWAFTRITHAHREARVQPEKVSSKQLRELLEFLPVTRLYADIGSEVAEAYKKQLLKEIDARWHEFVQMARKGEI